jgi:hypothetical protein
MLDLGWPKRISSSGGILVGKEGKPNIADTQTAIFEFDNVQVVWTHRTYGESPDPKYPWGATFHGDRGTLKASVMSYDFTPTGGGGGGAIHKDVTYELEQYPEDNTEPGIEKHTAPAIRYHLKDFLAAMGTRGKPVADVEEAHVSSASCILKLGRSLIWDAANGRVPGDDEANRLLRRPYRAPWVHPEPGNV